jgi:amino-acid N-acetyltransferase
MTRSNTAERSPAYTLRTALGSEARRIHALILANLAEGHLLPRTLEEVMVHADRFLVAVKGRTIVGCGELAPLSHNIVEVRSLVIDPAHRQSGLGRQIVDELRARGRRQGFEKLCAFTHQPGYFVRMGFSIVPHIWVPEKIFTDCVKCPLFRACGQYAMIAELETRAESSHTPELRA